MSKEIERKFLVINDSYKSMATHSIEIIQGYLSRKIEATVRVRITGDTARLTVKGANSGIVRNEWEYDIPLIDAREMLSDCASGRVISKTRYVVPYGGSVWEVDNFHGDLEGLTVAEIELPDKESDFRLPPFVGREVSGDPAYYNSNL